MKWRRLLIPLLFLGAFTTTFAQTTNCPPPNIGFEDGTFTNWTCMTGDIDHQGNLNLKPTGPVIYRQTMVDKNYLPKTDQYGNFPTLCPNGSGHSIILGNPSAVEGQTEAAFYTFTIPKGANQYSLTFNYAIVSRDDYSADPSVRPSFRVKVYDVTDAVYIDCASYYFTPSPTVPAPVWSIADPESPILPADRVYYQDWTAATVNLNYYSGKTLRLEFTTNHSPVYNPIDPSTFFCYAYIDVSQDCAETITGNTYCTGQTSVSLHAPAGFGVYNWYNSNDLTKQLGNAQTLTISPAPPDNTKYALITYTQNGFVCPDTLYTVVNKNDADFSFKVKSTLYACPDNPVDLTAASVTAGSSTNLTYSYFKNPEATQLADDPTAITQNGTYYIKGLSPAGCTNTLPVTVVVLNNEAINIANPPAVVFPATVDITSTYTPLDGFDYSYYLDNGGNTLLTDPKHVNQSGTYYIKALNTATGCATIAPVKVVISAPPPAVLVNTPNVFTPNNDGINESFSVTIKGNETFKWLKIYSRTGQVVFQTQSTGDFWDGTINGKPAVTGTYYWLVEGIDQYSHATIHQSGSITLIR